MFFFFQSAFSILLIKPRIFNISVDSSSLIFFSFSRPPLPPLQILERSNVLSQIYDILDLAISAMDFTHPNLFKIYLPKEFFNY